MLINLLNGKINRYPTTGSIHHMKKEETQKAHAGTLMALIHQIPIQTCQEEEVLKVYSKEFLTFNIKKVLKTA